MSSYDKTSPDSIAQYAAGLTGKSLADVVPNLDSKLNPRNRGDLGSLVEKYYFKHTPESVEGPDFLEAGVELKTTGVRVTKGRYRAKERLVLSMIDFDEIVRERWQTSKLLQKCKLMLILFYEYQQELQVINRRFVLPPVLMSLSAQQSSQSMSRIERGDFVHLRMPDIDLAIFQQDWTDIREKVGRGEAHKLSEGDTFYLGACRKGSGKANEPLRKQPNAVELAKSRAFSLKQGYLNRIVEMVSNDDGSPTPKEFLVSLFEAPQQQRNLRPEKRNASPIQLRMIEKAVQSRFDEYVGFSTDEIAEKLGLAKKTAIDKAFRHRLVAHVLSRGGEEILELRNADIEMKTVVVGSSCIPREHMSFPNFGYLQILEEEWEDSSFYKKLEKKFLFVVFQADETGVERLCRPFFWNMPFEDREEARRVWEETRRRVAVDASRLPGTRESPVAHVRPKARNSNDTQLTPQGTQLVKKCFWLHRAYIGRIISGRI